MVRRRKTRGQGPGQGQRLQLYVRETNTQIVFLRRKDSRRMEGVPGEPRRVEGQGPSQGQGEREEHVGRTSLETAAEME